MKGKVSDSQNALEASAQGGQDSLGNFPEDSKGPRSPPRAAL